MDNGKGEKVYIGVLYLLTICFICVIIIKINHKKPEWLLLLLMLSYIKTCLTYLFSASTVFTIARIGGIQIQLDDIVLIIALFYCLGKATRPMYGGKFLLSTLLLLAPILMSLFRGIIVGSLSMEIFLADTRKYILFISVFFAAYLLCRNPKTISRLWKFERYVDCLMNIVLIYVCIIWGMDLAFGINQLPGQQGGMLSDGGSTFRIINPPQVLCIVFYALYEMYKDLYSKKQLSLRTLLFCVVIILLQWRTAVAAFILGGVILITIFTKEKGFSRKLLFEIIILASLLIILLLQGDSTNGIIGMVTNLFESFFNVFHNTGTFSTRTQVWMMILSSLTGMDAVFGRPFGEELGISWIHSAHSGYIDFISKMGYLGVGCLIIFILFLIVQASRNKNYICVVLVFTQAVYWYGYGFFLEQGAILGLILAILEWQEQKNMNGGCYAK